MPTRFINTLNHINTLKVSFLWAGVLCLMLIAVGVQAAPKTLNVSTDRQTIEMGDVIDLVVQTDFQTFDDLDLSPLRDQFKILGTQRSTNVSIVNGQYNAMIRWDVSLTPKQMGELIVPPLTVDGVSSRPYKLTVTAMKHSGKLGVSFLESSVSRQKAYVQQEVIYTLKYYHLGRLIDGNTRPPVFGDAINKQLKNQTNYQKVINGQQYDVYEWSWAFYPQKSGKLTIPAEEFDGRLQYRNVIKMIHDVSKPISIDVLPQASQYPKDKTWLPTDQLTLKDQWQQPDKIRVGDSITRTIKLHAQHLMSSQLPDIRIENSNGYHVYPDSPKLSERVADQGINSTKTIKVAIVPLQAGKMTLPEIKVQWWNTATQQLETASLPAKTLNVLPALNTQSNLTPLTPNAPFNPQVSHETVIKTSWVWPTISAVFALLWLVTLSLYWRLLKQRHTTKAVLIEKSSNEGNIHSTDASLPRLCANKTKSAKQIYLALNQWEQNTPSAAETLKENVELSEAITALKAHLFHQTALKADTLDKICQVISINQSPSAQVKPAGKQLDPIYPE